MAPSNSSPDHPAADPLTVLLQLESALFRTGSVSELAFLLVNQLKGLIAYDQASFWRVAGGRLKIVQASAVSAPDPHAPYLQWLARVVRQMTTRSVQRPCRVVVAEDLPRNLAREWGEHIRGQALLVVLQSRQQRLLGVLWLTRATAWGEQEQMVLERFAEAATIVLESHRGRVRWWGRLRDGVSSRLWQGGVTLLLLAGLFTTPIHYSALAPAELVASDPVVVTAPMDGVMREVMVQPNQQVMQGAPLYALDRRPLESQLAIEQEGVQIAEAELLNASQKIFAGGSGEELEPLRSKIKQSQARVAWIEQQLEQTAVVAPVDGVVLNAETHSWRGKPVGTGEKIIVLADPRQIEVEIWLAVEDLQPLLQSKAIDLFLYSRSNQRVTAEFSRIGYQAELSPQGVMAYRVTAQLSDEALQLAQSGFRIGERGTAKLYGPETKLFYYLFRKPILWLRQWLA